MHICTPSIKTQKVGFLLVLNLPLSVFEDVLDELQFQHETFSLCIPELPASGATLTSAPCRPEDFSCLPLSYFQYCKFGQRPFSIEKMAVHH